MQVLLAEIRDPSISLVQAHCDITCHSLKNKDGIILNHKWTETIVCTSLTYTLIKKQIHPKI